MVLLLLLRPRIAAARTPLRSLSTSALRAAPEATAAGTTTTATTTTTTTTTGYRLPPHSHTLPRSPESLYHVANPSAREPEHQQKRVHKIPITRPQAVKRQRQILSQFERLGSTQNPSTVWRPAKAYKNPKDAQDVTLSQLFAAGAHIGHDKTQTLGIYHPYLIGWRNGQAVIDVENFTLPALKRAAAVVRKTIASDGLVLFVGTAPGMEKPIEVAVDRLYPNGYMYVNKHWTDGSITNAEVVQGPKIKNILQTWDKMGDDGPINTTALATMKFKPDLVVILNPGPNAGAAQEAAAARIPSIAIVDSNLDPRLATYPIPGNDDSPRFTALVTGVLARAGEQGLREKSRHLRHIGPEEADVLAAEEIEKSQKVEEQDDGADLYQETRAERADDRRRRSRR